MTLRLFVLLMLCLPGPSWATMGIGLTELCRASTNTCTTASVTSTNGSTFVVCMGGDGTPTTPTDSKSNTYTAIAAQLDLTVNHSRCYQALNATGGASHTFSGVVTGSTTMSLVAVEITTTGTISAGPSNAGSDTTTPFVSPGITTTAGSSTLVAFEMLEGNGATYTPTRGDGFTPQDSETDGNTFFPAYSATLLGASASSYNTSITLSATPDSTANWIMSYNEGGGGGATLHLLPMLGVGK